MVFINAMVLNIIIAIILYLAMVIDLLSNVFPYSRPGGYKTALLVLIILAAPIMWIMYIGHLVVCILTAMIRRS